MRGQGDCAGDAGQGVVEPPWRRWEEVGVTHVVEVGRDGRDLREGVMNAIHQSAMWEAMKGEVVRPTSDEDGQGNRAASEELEGSPLDCLWLRSMVSMASEALKRMWWEGSIRHQIRSMRHLSVRTSILAKSMTTRDGHMVVGTCPCETSGVVQSSYDRWSIRCLGRSCALFRIGGKNYALCGPVRQISSNLSIVGKISYLLLWLSDAFYSVATFYGVRFQVQRSRSAMKFEE